MSAEEQKEFAQLQIRDGTMVGTQFHMKSPVDDLHGSTWHYAVSMGGDYTHMYICMIIYIYIYIYCTHKDSTYRICMQ